MFGCQCSCQTGDGGDVHHARRSRRESGPQSKDVVDRQGLIALIASCLLATTAAKFAMLSSNALPEISISEEETLPLPSGASVMFVSTSMLPCP